MPGRTAGRSVEDTGEDSGDHTATLPSHRSPARRNTHTQHRTHICATAEVRVGGCA